MKPVPDEIMDHIAEYFVCQVDNYLLHEIRGVGRDLFSLQIGFGTQVHPDSIRWRRIYALSQKYYWYQADYAWSIKYRTRKGGVADEHPPLLIDACLSGCGLPCAYSSMRQFNGNVLDDIREIIELIPSALKSSYGQLRCRTHVTPLHAAIFNEAVPIEVIAYLLEKGANPADKIRINGDPCHVSEDLYGNLPVERIDAVLRLLGD
jgi:hypothetical protein